MPPKPPYKESYINAVECWFNDLVGQMSKMGVDINAPEYAGNIYWVHEREDITQEQAEEKFLNRYQKVPFRSHMNEKGGVDLTPEQMDLYGNPSAQFTYDTAVKDQKNPEPISFEQKAMMYDMAQKHRLFYRENNQKRTARPIIVSQDPNHSGKAHVMSNLADFMDYLDPEKTVEKPTPVEEPVTVEKPKEVSKPSLWKRFCNTVTFGRAYKKECQAYQEYGEKKRAFDNYEQQKAAYTDYIDKQKKFDQYQKKVGEITTKRLTAAGFQKPVFLDNIALVGITWDGKYEKIKEIIDFDASVKASEDTFAKTHKHDPYAGIKVKLSEYEKAKDANTMNQAFPELGNKPVPESLLETFQKGAEIKVNLCKQLINNNGTATLKPADRAILTFCTATSVHIEENSERIARLFGKQGDRDGVLEIIANNEKEANTNAEEMNTASVTALFSSDGASNMKKMGNKCMTEFRQKETGGVYTPDKTVLNNIRNPNKNAPTKKTPTGPRR